MKEIITIEIKKPLYGSFVYIRGDLLEAAARNRCAVEVRIPIGSAVVDPAEWISKAKAAKNVMKKVFNYPDRPMVLYGGYVPLKIALPKVEQKRKANTLFG